MEAQIKHDRSELRRFGLTVGMALFLLAAFLFWRQKPLWPLFLGLGGLFIGLGLLRPSWLAPVEKVWMIGARAMGWLMTRVILGLLFLLIFTPSGLILRLLGKDPLNLRFPTAASSYWQPRSGHDGAPTRMEKMF